MTIEKNEILELVKEGENQGDGVFCKRGKGIR